MATDSIMNAAGRDYSHPFADLRSASRAHQRSKKYWRGKARRKSIGCPFCTPPGYLRRLWQANEAKHDIQADSREWETNSVWLEDIDIAVGVAKHYRSFNEDADVFKSQNVDEDGWVQTGGENFGEWGRRRINEMRAVKEARIRSNLQVQEDNTHTNITTLGTTLPTSLEDIRAHDLVRSILSPVKRRYILSLPHRRSLLPYLSVPQKGLPYFKIHNFLWFGEFMWQWHRNASGCWELGHAACDNWSSPYSCNCLEGTCMAECYCSAFGDEPSPEDVQRCALTEWVKGPLWELLMRQERKQRPESEGEHGNENADMDWEVMSNATSEGWSVVSSEGNFTLVSPY